MKLAADDVQTLVIPGIGPLARRAGSRRDGGRADGIPEPLSKGTQSVAFELIDAFATAPVIIGRSLAGCDWPEKVYFTVIFWGEADRGADFVAWE
jgi:hypothetical protein